jgi:hypothetical protein
MLIIFRRTQLPNNKIRVIADGVIEGEHCEIGQLIFPNSKTWSRFWGAIQRGALDVKDLEVKLENLPLEEVTHEILDKPKDDKD